MTYNVYGGTLSPTQSINHRLPLMKHYTTTRLAHTMYTVQSRARNRQDKAGIHLLHILWVHRDLAIHCLQLLLELHALLHLSITNQRATDNATFEKHILNSQLISQHIYCTVWVQKSSPPKTFCDIFTRVKYISVKFCQHVVSSYLHIFTNFGRFILIFNKMALIFLGLPTVFNVFSFKFPQVKSP